MYDKSKPIYILKKSGIVVDFEECSVLAKKMVNDIYIYYSEKMANDIYGINSSDLKKFEYMLEKNRMYSNIEIEKKYIFLKEKKNEVEEQLDKLKAGSLYEVEIGEPKKQSDIYYDTKFLELKCLGHALRIREKEGKRYITFKSSINSISSGIEGQLERKEYEEPVYSNKIEDNKEFVEKVLKDVSKGSNFLYELIPNIKIINMRKKMTLTRMTGVNKNFIEKYEIVIDDVEYINLGNGKTYQECQLEIELKSSYQNRISMKSLTDEIEHNIKFLRAIDESKYQRALKYTE